MPAAPLPESSADPDRIHTLADLRARYGQPGERARLKQLPALDAHARRFIALSPFVVIATTGADGLPDASPRGGAPGFVQVLDEHTLLLPDSPGNNRLDGLENIIATGAAGLLFMIPGVDETLRVNGRASLSISEADRQRCTEGQRLPKLVIRLAVQEVYLHCAKAFMRSRLWQPEALQPRSVLPTMNQMIADQTGQATLVNGQLESQEAMLARYQKDL